MNILTIDDRPELKDQELKLLGKTDEQVLLTLDGKGKERLLYDVAENAKKITNDGNDWVIFINLFLACKDDEFRWQQNQAGIALVKFLRMMEVSHHVVLISPYTFEQLIRQHPGNLIISSKGISITQCSYDFSEFTEEKLETLAKEIFSGDLKSYILAEFRLPEDERHNWANWWGIVRLVDVHRSLFPEELCFASAGRYPGKLDTKLKKLMCVQALESVSP